MPSTQIKLRKRRLKSYTAQVGFTLFAIWIAVIFVLASGVTST